MLLEPASHASSMVLSIDSLSSPCSSLRSESSDYLHNTQSSLPKIALSRSVPALKLKQLCM